MDVLFQKCVSLTSAILEYNRTSTRGRGKNTRKAPAYKRLSLTLHILRTKRLRTHRDLPLIGFLPLEAVPLIEI
jgi:hypothetical protein